MNRLLAEQGSRYDERFDASKAPEFGKLLGVDAIVTGNITSLSAQQQTSAGPGGLANAVGGVIPGFGKKQPKMNTDNTTVDVKVEITAEMISTVTGQILASHRADGEAKKQVSGKIQVNNQGTNDTSASKSGFDPYVREALLGAVKQVGLQFAATYVSAPRAPKTTVLASSNPAVNGPQATTESEYLALADEVGNVGKVDGQTITFFAAPGAKIAAGDVLTVQHPEIVKNPRTGKPAVIGEDLGTLTVTSVSGETGRGTYQGKPVTNLDRLVKGQTAAAPARAQKNQATTKQ
jgi:hypothetical protein